ncbi:hypothetical protein AC482_02650 [miscellaneous Crenarchaeota group-15 archaeon DG-45]|uniref:ECF transporter S component n=1 Tax=miscellaneous Crenarchaeota group-15 archaeon DG-45 TaxID=1685127 RepID=A0A0M0BQK4_9ARCH|nr:MAG: hypothetical protein AC482_02650 [miscellaneous Crenarchaeota group-15 archaeon DG-45]
MPVRSRDIALSSLFGVVIFAQKALLPAPYDKVVSVLVQIVFLSLAFLMTGFPGPILTGFISGLLTASMRGGLALMTFSFALLYGVLVSSLNRLLAVAELGHVRLRRLVASTLASTLLVGVLSAAASAILGIIPYNPALFSMIIVAGAVQGVAGGLISGIAWEKYLRNLSSAS